LVWARRRPVEKLEIKWPGGQLETVSIPGIDRKLTVTQGKGITSRYP
jgi:hypothetical protein